MFFPYKRYNAFRPRRQGNSRVNGPRPQTGPGPPRRALRRAARAKGDEGLPSERLGYSPLMHSVGHTAFGRSLFLSRSLFSLPSLSSFFLLREIKISGRVPLTLSSFPRFHSFDRSCIRGDRVFDSLLSPEPHRCGGGLSCFLAPFDFSPREQRGREQAPSESAASCVVAVLEMV